MDPDYLKLSIKNPSIINCKWGKDTYQFEIFPLRGPPLSLYMEKCCSGRETSVLSSFPCKTKDRQNNVDT